VAVEWGDVGCPFRRCCHSLVIQVIPIFLSDNVDGLLEDRTSLGFYGSGHWILLKVGYTLFLLLSYRLLYDLPLLTLTMDDHRTIFRIMIYFMDFTYRHRTLFNC